MTEQEREKLVGDIAKALFKGWVKPPKGYGKLRWQDEPTTIKNIWMRRAEAVLAVAEKRIRDAVLEEVATWHSSAAKMMQETIDMDSTTFSADMLTARMAGHSADADTIRAMKGKADDQ